MEISIIGSGHVGLVTGACFADLGNRVVCVDNDPAKIASLKKGRVPFFEPGLAPLVRQGLKTGCLNFTTAIGDGLRRGQVLFIAVGTPPKEDGEADLSGVEHVAREIAACLRGYRLIIEKSTVPVETGRWIRKTLETALKGRKASFDVASNPEFLREGTAIQDFLHPDRIVLGVESKRAEGILRELYRPFSAPLVVTDIASAELIKHASNAFLATKISFINAVAVLCERVGADVEKVAQGMGLDPRIGPAFLGAGAGYGGFCLPKDIEAFIRISERLGYNFELLKAVQKINAEVKEAIVQKVEKELWNLKGKRIGLLGLSFKPDTDDMRLAPSLDVIEALSRSGAQVAAYDPQAMPAARALVDGVSFAKDPYALARGCDCLVIMTEWNEFKEINLERLKRAMRHPVVVDGRNLFDPGRMRKLGFRYVGVGRGESA